MFDIGFLFQTLSFFFFFVCCCFFFACLFFFLFIFPRIGQLSALLNDPSNFSAKETKKVAAGSRKFDAVVSALSARLNLHTVQTTDSVATFFGKSIQDHLVAVILRASDSAGTYTVDLKSSDARLASSLVKELDALF